MSSPPTGPDQLGQGQLPLPFHLTRRQLAAELRRCRAHCNQLELALEQVTGERDVAVDGLHRLRSELLASKFSRTSLEVQIDIPL